MQARVLLRLAVKKNSPAGTVCVPLVNAVSSPCFTSPITRIAPARRAWSSASRNMARPLRGLKVLDLGNFLAGPVVSMHLGAMGADVIKLERITGDDSRAIGPMAADGGTRVERAPRERHSSPAWLRHSSPAGMQARARLLALSPTRTRARRELVFHVGQPGQALCRGRHAHGARQAGAQGARPPLRRPRRELPARRDGQAGRRLRRARPGEPEADLRLEPPP